MSEFGKVVVHGDGSATAYTGSSGHGQGHDTSFAMLVTDTLGIPMEKVTVRHGDTDEVARGVGTFGSRSLQLGGSAIFQASGQVLDKARQLAADLLEADPADIVLDRASGAFHVQGTPAVSRSWAEVASAAGEGGLEAETDFQADSPTYPFGAHVAVVEVDTETGLVRLVRMVTSTTRAASSTRCWSRASATAASPRAWPRPSTSGCATTRTATPRPPTWPTTR